MIHTLCWAPNCSKLHMQKLLTFFSVKILALYAIFNDESFDDKLINDIVSFEQLGPGL